MNSNENNSKQNHCRHHRHRMWKFPFFIAAATLIKSGFVLLLWNALIPETFHGPELNYLQALELTVLFKILVGFGGGLRHRCGHHHHKHGGWHRWMHMSAEERAKMKEELKQRCGK